LKTPEIDTLLADYFLFCGRQSSQSQQKQVNREI